MATPRSHGRGTPQDSPASDANTPGETTLTRLQRLPRHLGTPSRYSMPGSPWTGRRTPRRRVTAAPSTPYGLRAMQRRAANTPSRDRRKSGRVQRESTFDVLKTLGKALAPTSQLIHSSPSVESKPPSEEVKDEIDELDREPEVERPRLSLPIEEEDEEGENDGGIEMRPPRLSLAIDEEEITLRSVEYPREAGDESNQGRPSLMSYAGVRLSENFGETTGLESGSERGDDTGLRGAFEGEDDTTISQGAFDKGGETQDLGRFNFTFDFPSPAAPAIEDPAEVPMHDEVFELTAMDVQPDLAATDFPSSDDAAGGFGLDLNLSPQASLSESPGIIGGGLRNEDISESGPKQKKLSRHGIPIPNIPSGVVRKLATQFARSRAMSKTKINRDTLAAIEQATSWFFEQMSEDLAVYSKHAGRSTIDESDVMTLMRRQRHINNSTTIFSLAQRHLPKELLQEMRLVMPP